MSKFRNKVKQVLGESQPEFGFEYSYSKFDSQVSELRKRFEETEHLNQYFKKGFALESEYLEFVYLKNSQLVSSLWHYVIESKKIEQVFPVSSYSYQAIRDLLCILTVIANNHFALLQMHLNGFDFQGKVIFRSTIELTELCICILGDKELYTHFREQNKIDDRDQVFQTVKFGTLKKTTGKIIKNIRQTQMDKFPMGIWDNYLQMREDFYDQASKHVHSNLTTILMSAYVPLIEIEEAETPDHVIMNLGGMINKLTRQNIHDIIFYDSISHILILLLLLNNHGLHTDMLSKDIDHLKVFAKLNLDLLAIIID